VTTLTLSITIPAPRAEVWEDFSQLSRHVEWMHDAVRIDFLSDHQRGLGTSFRCVTKVGPFTTDDIMTVNRWDEGSAVGVEHRGLISGVGVFQLAGEGQSTTLTWQEQLHFPWWLGGALTETVATPILRLIWRKNLKNFSRRFTSSH
jgi:uncharacterized protein YndB with AHSA1/START domain